MRTSRFAPVIAALCMLQLSCCKENEPQPQPKKVRVPTVFMWTIDCLKI